MKTKRYDNPMRTTSAKDASGDFDKFTKFMRRLVAVPHSEIKTKLDAEKAEKRTPKNTPSNSSLQWHSKADSRGSR